MLNISVRTCVNGVQLNWQWEYHKPEAKYAGVL